MKAAVYGAAGFIGRRLVGELADHGHACAGFDVAGATGCDVTRDEIRLARGTDAVFYLAQWPHYRDFPAGGDALFAVNAIGALRVASAAVEAGARFLCYASSGSVYAPSFDPRGEEDNVRRDDAYALSKVMGEEMLALLADRMTISAVRLFGVFGPRQTRMLVPGIMDRLREGRAVVLQPHPTDPDDRDGLRISLTYVDDAVAILRGLGEAALEGRDVGGPINVAGPEPVSLRSLATRLGAAIGHEPRFEIAPEPRRSDFVADIGRLRALLAPSFTGLDVAVRRTVDAQVAAR